MRCRTHLVPQITRTFELNGKYLWLAYAAMDPANLALAAVVERIRDANDSAELAHHVLLHWRKLAEWQVLRRRMRLTMVARDIRDQIQVNRIERTRSGALDQIVGMFVMLLI